MSFGVGRDISHKSVTTSEGYVAHGRRLWSLKVMIKSRLWHEVLDLELCWRFFKYKLILDDTCHKFERDKKYLEHSSTHETDHASGWRLPCQFRIVLNRLNCLTPNMEALKNPLSEINQMIRNHIPYSTDWYAYNFTSIHEAQFSSRSSHNSEYLAIMATFFIPLSLFAVQIVWILSYLMLVFRVFLEWT